MDPYIVALLERIAYNTQAGPLEFNEYIKRIKADASSKPVSAPLHGDMRARAPTRTGYVPKPAQI